MPQYVTYYPLLYSPYSRKDQSKDQSKVCYVAVGGKNISPTEPMVPLHGTTKADTVGKYPSIVQAKNITSDVVQLSLKGQKVDGYCWFRTIYSKQILDLFEWKPASEFAYSAGHGSL